MVSIIFHQHVQHRHQAHQAHQDPKRWESSQHRTAFLWTARFRCRARGPWPWAKLRSNQRYTSIEAWSVMGWWAMRKKSRERGHGQWDVRGRTDVWKVLALFFNFWIIPLSVGERVNESCTETDDFQHEFSRFCVSVWPIGLLDFQNLAWIQGPFPKLALDNGWCFCCGLNND